jgi:outer membrane protein OmpA-like peptidoglycan-associated protein/tetratricopeptide (TPR) repeat protein
MGYKYSSILLFLLFALASCTYTLKVKEGEMAVDRKQYSVAEKLLKKEYNKEKSRVARGQKAFLLGKTYRALNESDKSMQWFQTAYDNGYGVDALKELAYAQKRAEQYQEAMMTFKELGLEIGSPYEYRREIAACQIAIGWKDIKQPEYKVTPLDFNSSRADYAPTLFKDNQLVFTSDRTGSTGDDQYKWTGNDFSDLYVVDLNSESVSNFDMMINTPDNEGTVTFSSDYQEMYFTRCYGGKKEDAYCNIMRSEYSNGAWSVPQALKLFEETDLNYGHPSLSADGQYLYFSCNHPDGWGGYDIYVCRRLPSGEWSVPELMGRSINTIGNEKFPFIDQDTLYFSSDFHPGMGGLDICRTFKLNNGSWGPAFNIKPPINSGGDDFGYTIDYSAPKRDPDLIHTGYFSSTRLEGLGGDDIYKFEKRYVPPPPPPPVAENEPPEEEQYQLILEGYVLEKIYESENDPNSRILGRKPLPNSQVVINFKGAQDTLQLEEDGFFRLELEEASDYQFIASKEEYLTNQEFFTTKGIGRNPNMKVQTFEIEIVLDRIFLDKEIELENIYYDFDESFIRDDAKPTLDILASNLELNPNIRIQLGSHTDCRGRDNYNLELSQRRAQAAVDYLIQKGISPNRLLAKGYGEEAPAIDCICSRCTEEEHQENRRTTFKIIE